MDWTEIIDYKIILNIINWLCFAYWVNKKLRKAYHEKYMQ